MRNGSDALVILIVLLLAFGLRVGSLPGRDLWGDEAFSVAVMQLPVAEMIQPNIDTHPPLYHLWMTLWLRLAGLTIPVQGIDPFPIRFGSLVLGMLAVPVTYALARRLAGRAVALLALLLMAVSPLQVYYSGELRMYSLLALTSTLSVLAFVALTQKPGRTAWLFYLGMTLAAMCAHYNAFWVIAAQNVVALFGSPWRGRRLRWIGGQALLALLYLPWVVVQAPFILERGGSRGSYALLPERIVDIWGQSLRSWAVGRSDVAGFLSLLALLAGLIAAGIGLWTAWRSAHWQGMLLGGWVGLTLLLVALMDPLMPFFHERFAIAGSAAFLFLAAWGIYRSARRCLLAGLILGGLFIVGGLAGNLRPAVGLLEAQITYAGAMRMIAAEAAPGDLILFSNEQQMALRGYYAPPDVPNIVLSTAEVNSPRTDVYLAQAVGDATRAWLVEYGDPIGYDSMRLVPAWLAEHGFRQRFFSYDGGTVSLYVMGEDAAPFIPMNAQFGENIRLTGYRLVPDHALPGDVLRLSLRWEALGVPLARYTVGNYVLNEAGQLVAQTDAEPRGGASPTDSWRRGDVIEDRYAIPLPPDLSPGTYTLAVGLYAWPDTTRLPVQGDSQIDGALLLTTFTVGAR